jgi:hypothetical protein
LLAVVAIVVAVLIGVATIVATLIASSGSGPTRSVQSGVRPHLSIADQADALRHNLASQGWQIQQSREFALRGDGRRSMVLLLRRGPSCTPSSQSDELRIYDVDAGSLRLGLSFQPDVLGCNAMTFRILGVGKYHAQSAPSTDTEYLLGVFSGGEGPDLADVPVAIAWDPKDQTYQLRPLLRSGAALLQPAYSDGPLTGTDRWWFDEVVKRFTSPITLTPTVSGWAASDVTLRTTGSAYAPAIAGIYRLTAGNPSQAGAPPTTASQVAYEAAIWSIYTNVNGRLLAGNCRLPINTATVINSASAPDTMIHIGGDQWMKHIIGYDADPSVP